MDVVMDVARFDELSAYATLTVLLGCEHFHRSFVCFIRVALPVMEV